MCGGEGTSASGLEGKGEGLGVGCGEEMMFETDAWMSV